MEKPVIVTEKGIYHLYEYQNESELERMIVEHSSEIFGKNSFYFDIKKKIKSKSGFGTIPDGYVIDLKKKKLYIVEVELIRHDLRKHILPQITSFIIALENKNSQEELVKIFKEELKSFNKVTLEELKAIISNYGIIILIDEVGDPMEEINPLLEIVNFLSKHGEVIAMPFQTYIKDKNISDHVHSFKSFTKEELEQESKKWTFKWTTVSPQERIEKLDDNLKEVFIEVGKRICCIAANIKEVHPKSGYTTYQISKLKNFCAIKFPKGCLEVYLKVNSVAFTDPNRTTNDIQRSSNWTFDKVFSIKSKEEINYAIYLIEQAYQSMVQPK